VAPSDDTQGQGQTGRKKLPELIEEKQSHNSWHKSVKISMHCFYFILLNTFPPFSPYLYGHHVNKSQYQCSLIIQSFGSLDIYSFSLQRISLLSTTDHVD
jgi:hypothetical protein